MREWDVVRREEARVPEEAILAFLDELEAERVRLHGFAMLEEGRLLAEGYWAPFTASSLHRMYSVGKSFVSLAIGLLQQEGKLALEDAICRYFPEKCPEGGPHPWLAELTIKQMLKMATCHSKTTYKQYGGDWVESFFRVEPTNLPGAVFSYDTSSTHVLSALVERLSGRKLMDYLREKCFDRIGVSKEAYFIEDPAGVSQGGSGLNCTLRDLLAVAQLVTEGGVYQGEQLLPADYLAEATTCQISTLHQPVYDEQFGYGYQIWRGRHHCFYFYGIGGQLAVCLPREHFVFATMGNTLENKNGIKDIFDAFFEKIYPWISEERAALQGKTGRRGPEYALAGDQESDHTAEIPLKDVPPGEQGAESLARRLSGLTLSENGGGFWKRDPFWNGRWYSFSENRLRISRLMVALNANGGTLYLEKEGREWALTFGKDTYVSQGWPWGEACCLETGKEPGNHSTGDSLRVAGEVAQKTECCCQGFFCGEDTLLLRCHILGPELANLVILLHFQKAGATIKMQKSADNGMKNFDGVASSVS